MDLMADPIVVVLLVAASGLAGFVDAIAGGGGLVLLPALLIGLPTDVPIPTLLGTNKLAAISGTTAAAWRYGRESLLDLRTAAGPVLAAMTGSAFGAHLAYGLDPTLLRPVMLVLLAGMLVFTLARPDVGRKAEPRFAAGTGNVVASGLALVIGFYDGFFGPGTGSLLLFLYAGVLGLDFLRASALAKAANWGSNAAALALFLSRGSFLPLLAVLLAVANVAGGQAGARLAIAKGNAWIRRVFVIVVGALLARLAWQVVAGDS